MGVGEKKTMPQKKYGERTEQRFTLSRRKGGVKEKKKKKIGQKDERKAGKKNSL